MSGTRDFNLALMGYDRGQVDAFCDEMDEIIGELRGRADDLEQQLEQMQLAKPITAEQAFANVARETQRILQAAQEAGTRMVEESREQAESELALARRERSQIVGDGYRARDEMSEQLRQLDRARARLIRQLQDATAEIDRLTAGLEEGGRRGVEEASSAARRAERALTGTDQGRRPLGEGERQRAGGRGSLGEGERQRAGGRGSLGEGERQRAGGRGSLGEGERQRAGGRGSLGEGASLRVIPGTGDPRSSRTRTTPREPTGRRPNGVGGDVFADKRDQVGPLRVVLIECLNDGLGAVRDRLRERLRRASDTGGSAGAVTFDDADVAAIAEEGAVQLRQAFDLGARVAAAERTGLVPATGGQDVHVSLAAVLDERVGAPIRELLAEGDRVDDPPWVLVERIDGIVSDASAAMVSQIAETELSRAFERGKLATWSNNDVSARRWVVTPHGHRSDETCRGNADAAAVPVAAPFPSGEHTPPRRDGCTCTTVAANEESDP